MTRVPLSHAIFHAWMFVTSFAFTSRHTKLHHLSSTLLRTKKHCFSRASFSLDSTASGSTTGASEDPQVFATGFSPKLDLFEAIQEAVDTALAALPEPTEGSKIDLAFVSISSLYDGQTNPSMVVSAILSSASIYGSGVQNLLGTTTGGIYSSVTNYANRDTEETTKGDEGSVKKETKECIPIESEGVPGVSITFAILPDVEMKTFHVLGDDVPDDFIGLSPDSFRSQVGLSSWMHEPENPSFFMLIPSPAFQNELDDMLRGLSYAFPACQIFGGIASTVSSLSRARLFRYDAKDPNCIQTIADGCVGLALKGDIEVKTMVAQGAKPVGGVYRIVKGEQSTINAIVLDEAATEEDAVEEEEEDEAEVDQDAKAKLAAAYAKARIPKPTLAEANFVMKTLSDDDQSFMRKALLVGIERGGAVGRSANELLRLAKGEGHRFTVHQVASAGMKDGSVTLPLGSVNIEPGTRFRFFVREGEWAKKEVEAIWMGYKKQRLEECISGQSFNPSGAMIFSTLDRGATFFSGKGGYESSQLMTFVPTIPSLSGFYSNGVFGKVDDNDAESETMVYGSASGFALFGSKSNRPVYSPARALLEKEAAARREAEEAEAASEVEAEDKKRQALSKAAETIFISEKAPRGEDGELIIKRREIHAGRAISVSTVQWSVAEKSAKPSSAIEGYMWEKETEVDRFRERVPLSNLLSQCKLASVDPTKPKPRDWIGPVKRAGSDSGFVIIPECKRMEPTTGSLRKRYDLSKLVNEWTLAGAPALSVNCDGILFGGSLEDVTKAREASSAAAMQSESASEGVEVPPILASDLILYPYQLYKLRLSGADAVTLVAGSLDRKDFVYLSKIAASVRLQVLVSVTSTVQVDAVTDLSVGSVNGLLVSNRELEDFSINSTGEQALSILNSESMKRFKDKHDVPVLVEGQVGVIKRPDEAGALSPQQYIKELKEAGAFGAIVGSGLAQDGASLESLLECQTE